MPRWVGLFMPAGWRCISMHWHDTNVDYHHWQQWRILIMLINYTNRFLLKRIPGISLMLSACWFLCALVARIKYLISNYIVFILQVPKLSCPSRLLSMTVLRHTKTYLIVILWQKNQEIRIWCFNCVYTTALPNSQI